MKKYEELKKIIEDYKEFDGDIFQKSLDYLEEVGYLEIGFGEVEVYSDAEEEHHQLNNIFEWINEGNAKLLIRLNNLLEAKDRDNDINKLEEKMREIQVKKYITVKEFEKIYNRSSSTQKSYRSRLNDPLPYLQNKVDSNGNKIVGGKITYDVEEVEKWMDNNFR